MVLYVVSKRNVARYYSSAARAVDDRRCTSQSCSSTVLGFPGSATDRSQPGVAVPGICLALRVAERWEASGGDRTSLAVIV